MQFAGKGTPVSTLHMCTGLFKQTYDFVVSRCPLRRLTAKFFRDLVNSSEKLVYFLCCEKPIEHQKQPNWEFNTLHLALHFCSLTKHKSY